MTRRVLMGLLLATIAVADAAPRFDGDAAWRHLEQLVAFGPRPSGSDTLVRARGYIVDQLTKAGLRVRVSPFEARTPVGPVKMSNIVAMIPGKRADVILLGGHYDTKLFADSRFVGANDGGSSAALLIELARQLARTRPAFSYWIVFFDGEEARVTWSPTDSLYGSRYLVGELRSTGELKRLRSVIVVDMIGDRRLGIRRESHSTPWLTEIIWATARRLGHGAHFLSDELAVEDDHLPFLQAGVPSALIIDLDYPPWHTPDDTMRRVSRRSLRVVGEVVLNALPQLETVLAREPVGGSK
jgi:Zn-dependent M28 family amino/carboxypeptidase